MDLSTIDQNEKWLIGLSCGPDSMALLYKCLEANLNVSCAFVNYHHRKQAELEERYAVDICKQLGVELFVRNEPFDEGSENFEAKARDWRYEFFATLIKEHGFKGVLVGHHQDDLLETYFMQKEKGIVPMCYGLQKDGMVCGIKVKRILLDETKDDLIDYCNQNNIKYYVDHTNFDESYTRNRIRHQKIAHLTKMERNETLTLIAKENEALRGLREKASGIIEGEQIAQYKYRLEDQDVRVIALRFFLEDEYASDRMSLKHLEEIDHVLMNKDDFDLVVKQKRLVIKNGFIKVIEFDRPYSYTIHSVEDLWEIENPYFSIEKGEPSVYSVTVSEDDFPLTIRNVQAGDVIKMRYGSKRIHRFFIDRKIPLFERNMWPCVLNRHNEIILVPKIGCDVSHYSISPSFSVLQCSLYEKKGNLKWN